MLMENLPRQVFRNPRFDELAHKSSGSGFFG
jgi:hypothetical protein